MGSNGKRSVIHLGVAGFVAVCVGIFAVCVGLDVVNQLRSPQKSIREMKANFSWAIVRVSVLRVFVGFAVMIVSAWFWHYMGWKSGQPIHLSDGSH
jgi:uncharacterized membrane protein